MAKLTEEQLISQLRELKSIEPNQNWAFSLKSQILAQEKAESVFSFGWMFQKRASYAFVAIALLIVGFFGFTQFGNLINNSHSTVAEQAKLNNDIVAFNNKVHNLAVASKQGGTDVTSEIKAVNDNASELTKSIKNGSASNPTALKEIAISLKTLADSGTNLTKTTDVQNLYQTVVAGQIEDLKKQTLSDTQKTELTKIEDLYAKGKYADALEAILLIGKN